MMRSMLCGLWIAAILMLMASANAEEGAELPTSTHHDHDILRQKQRHSESERQLRGSGTRATTEVQQQWQSPSTNTGRKLDDVHAVIYILFLFGSTNGEFTSWSLYDHIDGDDYSDATQRTAIAYASAGTYKSVDTTELISLKPGQWYDFNITNASSDDSSIEYTIVLSEPAFSVGGGQVLSGSNEMLTFYLPTAAEVLATITVPTEAPAKCAARGEVCSLGSDCCSERCSPETFLCSSSPEDAEDGDRDKLTEGEVGGSIATAFEDSSSASP